MTIGFLFLRCLLRAEPKAARNPRQPQEPCAEGGPPFRRTFLLCFAFRVANACLLRTAFNPDETRSGRFLDGPVHPMVRPGREGRVRGESVDERRVPRRRRAREP